MKRGRRGLGGGLTFLAILLLLRALLPRERRDAAASPHAQVAAPPAADPAPLSSAAADRSPVGRDGAPDAGADAGDVGHIRLAVVDARTGRPLEELSLLFGMDVPQPPLAPSGVPLGPRFRGGEVTLGVPAEVSGLEVRVEVASPGHVSQELVGPAPPPGRQADWGVLRLAPASTLALRVLDPSGAPAAGALVLALQDAAPGLREELVAAAWSRARGGRGTARGPGFEIGRTDDAGRLSLSTLVPGTVAVFVDHAGAAPGSFLGLAAKSAQELRLALPAAALVRVLRADGEPAPDVPVSSEAPELDPWTARLFPEVARASGRTDRDGACAFAGLLAREHRFRVPEDGGAGTSPSFAFDLGGGRGVRSVGGVPDLVRSATLEPGERVELAFRLPPVGGLAGRVFLDDQPLPGARVKVSSVEGVSFGEPTGPEQKTDADGGFAFPAVHAGRWQLEVDHAELALPWQETIEQTERGAWMEIRIRRSGVRGTVLGPDGLPLAGVEVAALGGGEREPVVTPIAMAEAGAGGRVRHTLQRLRRAGSAATTDAAGRYALHDLPAGVPLAIIARGATTLPARSGRLVLAPEEERVVDLRLAAGGILAVHVLDADGAPLSGCLVHLRPEAEGGERMETTDSAGIARLVSLPGGDYQLACDWPWTGAPPSERPPRPVHVDAGSQEEVVIRW